MHQPGDVLEVDVTREEFLVIEDADASLADGLVAIEGEVDLLDAMSFGTRTKLGFGSRSSTAEENAVGRCHRAIILPR
jgi:hypothetical protein